MTHCLYNIDKLLILIKQKKSYKKFNDYIKTEK